MRASAQALHGRIGCYVFVSAVMVYGDATERPVHESHPRVPPAAEDGSEIDGATYGPLKVACEVLVREGPALDATVGAGGEDLSAVGEVASRDWGGVELEVDVLNVREIGDLLRAQRAGIQAYVVDGTR